MNNLIKQLDDILPELGSRPGNLVHLDTICEAMTELERLRAIEAAAREVVANATHNFDGHNEIVLDVRFLVGLRKTLALSGGEGK